jgi:hypothetical protein
MLWLTLKALPLLLFDPESGETTKLPDCFRLLPLLRMEVVSRLGAAGGVERGRGLGNLGSLLRWLWLDSALLLSSWFSKTRASMLFWLRISLRSSMSLRS